MARERTALHAPLAAQSPNVSDRANATFHDRFQSASHKADRVPCRHELRMFECDGLLMSGLAPVQRVARAGRVTSLHRGAGALVWSRAPVPLSCAVPSRNEIVLPP